MGTPPWPNRHLPRRGGRFRLVMVYGVSKPRSVKHQKQTGSGRVLTYGQLLRRVWGADLDGDVRPMRTAISSRFRLLLTYIARDARQTIRYRQTEPLGDFSLAHPATSNVIAATSPKGSFSCPGRCPEGRRLTVF